MLPFQYYFFLFLRYCSFSARRLFCTDVPPPAGKMGAAAHRLGWSKPIQCDSVISLQYETNDLITVHLNEHVKDLCVYICNLASSSRIPFTLKTEIFFYVLAYRPRVPGGNGYRKYIFKKLSREEIFENSALSFSCEQTKTDVFEYGDLINHTAMIRIRYG